MLATDWAPDAIAMTERNAARNGLAIEALCVSWTAPEPLLARAPWDLVLASDVLYEARNGDALLPLLPRLVDAAARSGSPTPAAPPPARSSSARRRRSTIDARAAAEIPQGGVHYAPSASLGA